MLAGMERAPEARAGASTDRVLGALGPHLMALPPGRRVGLLDGLPDQAPVALALDDLHWADTATVELLHYLAAGPPARSRSWHEPDRPRKRARDHACSGSGKRRSQ
jgi:hypothetical protein